MFWFLDRWLFVSYCCCFWFNSGIVLHVYNYKPACFKNVGGDKHQLRFIYMLFRCHNLIHVLSKSAIHQAISTYTALLFWLWTTITRTTTPPTNSSSPTQMQIDVQLNWCKCCMVRVYMFMFTASFIQFVTLDLRMNMNVVYCFFKIKCLRPQVYTRCVCECVLIN